MYGRLIVENGNIKISSEYDSSQIYIPRSLRKEWNPISLTGQVAIIKGQPVAPHWIKFKENNINTDIWLIR